MSPLVPAPAGEHPCRGRSGWWSAGRGELALHGVLDTVLRVPAISRFLSLPNKLSG